MIVRNRRHEVASAIAPASSVSANPLIDVSGVLSSCDTFAVSSRRSRSLCRSSVTSRTTATTPPALAPGGRSGVACTSSRRSSGGPRLTSSSTTAPCAAVASINRQSGCAPSSGRSGLPRVAAPSPSRSPAARLTSRITPWASTATTASFMLEMIASTRACSSLTAASFCRSSAAIVLKDAASCAISSSPRTLTRLVRSPAAMAWAACASSSTGHDSARARHVPSAKAAIVPSTSAVRSAHQAGRSARSTQILGRLTCTTPRTFPLSRMGAAAKTRASPPGPPYRTLEAGSPCAADATSGPTGPGLGPSDALVGSVCPLASRTPMYTWLRHAKVAAILSSVERGVCRRPGRSSIRATISAWLRTSR